jgi:MFS family permease
VSAVLPGLLLGPAAGALADRWDRRTTMVLADIGRAGTLLVLLAEPGRHVIWLVYLVGAGQGCLSQLFAPARTATLHTLVPPTQLAAANSAVAAGPELALLGGPVLGGAVYAFAGLRLSGDLDVVSYLVSAVTIAALRSGV